jgi:ligand-binding SRPBCC domain-containing protein
MGRQLKQLWTGLNQIKKTERAMATYQKYEEMEVLASIDEVWDFISSPSNLKEITPDYMGFEITSHGLPEKVYPGLMISYRVRPVLGINMNWLTEITQVEAPYYFVDEQRAGPYALWHHEHRLRPTEKGVIMTDLVTYRPPAGPLGDLARMLFPLQGACPEKTLWPALSQRSM